MRIKIESPDMIMWHWYEALKELGVDVHTPWITLDYKIRIPNPKWNPDLNYDYQIAEHPMYFKGKAKTVLYLTDVPKYSPPTSCYDLVFSASKMKGGTIYIPFGCPTRWFFEERNANRTMDTCFIGNNHNNRWLWLEELGVDCFIANWNESRKIYSQHKIRVMPPSIFADVEGVPSDMHTTSVTEGMACNILTIAPHRRIPKFKSLVLYGSQQEARELIDYYLKHDKERVKKAKEQMEEVLAEHTWKHRMEEVLKWL